MDLREGYSLGFSAQNSPSVLFCWDIVPDDKHCCKTCHASDTMIMIHPWSPYSTEKQRMPDMGFGIRAEVCCNLFDYVRQLPRSWWVGRYAKKKGWSEADGLKLAQADPQKYYKVWGEIADSYSTGSERNQVTKRDAPPQRKTSLYCPKCGTERKKQWCVKCGDFSPGIRKP